MEKQEILTHSFADDDPASVYDELKTGERAVKRAADEVFTTAEHEARAHAEYEEAKNTLLLELFNEENEGTVKKRTEAHRQAIYRLKFAKKRLEWQLAMRDAEAQKSYLDALESIQTSIEARAKLISLDARFAGGKYGT